MPGYLREKLLEVVKAVLPLVIVITILHFVYVRMPAHTFLQFLAGVALVIAGMFLFLVGIDVGILPLGEAIGGELPGRNSLLLVTVVGFLIGFTATIAEPDVIVLTRQVQVVSRGEVSQSLLIYTIGVGTAFFTAIALLRVVWGVRLAYLLTGGYVVVLALSFFVPPEFVPLAFDAGGVAMGPVTVPLVLALGLGFSSVMGGRSLLSDGLGIIALGSISPVIAVMLVGAVLG